MVILTTSSTDNPVCAAYPARNQAVWNGMEGSEWSKPRKQSAFLSGALEKFRTSLFQRPMATCCATRHPQRNRQRRPPVTPDDPGVRLGESKRGIPQRVSANHAQSPNGTTKARCRAGREDALNLAPGALLPRNYGRKRAFGKRFEDWLRNVQARTKCKDCGINLETRTLSRRKRDQLTGIGGCGYARTGFLT